MNRLALCILPAVAATALAAVALPASAAGPNDNCFRLSQVSSTHADGDRTIYVRVGVSSFYRIDLANRCASLPYQGNHLVLTPTPGSDMICRPLDLDLKVSDHGVQESCFIKSITRLTPAEAAAIPKKVKP